MGQEGGREVLDCLHFLLPQRARSECARWTCAVKRKQPNPSRVREERGSTDGHVT
jgi:hypothetical protein